MNTLAFIVIVVTSTAGGIPAGTGYWLKQPTECSVMDDEIRRIEALGGTADGWCIYTNAPATSLRPKMRPERT
jgi:hypothetical protein